MSQCWPRSLSPYDVTRPQWIKWDDPHCICFSAANSCPTSPRGGSGGIVGHRMPTVVPNLMPLAAAYAAHARSKDVVAPPVEEKLELPPAVVAPPVAPTATPPIRPALPEVRHTPPEVRPTPREVSKVRFKFYLKFLQKKQTKKKVQLRITVKSLYIRCAKSQNLNDSRFVLQLSLPNPLKPGVKLWVKM